MKPSLLIFLICTSISFTAVFGQVSEQPKTQFNALEKLKDDLLQKSMLDQAFIINKAAELGLPLRLEHQDGSISELDRFVDNFPLYVTTNNRIAAVSTSTSPLWPGGSSGFNLTGKGFIIGEWDGGAVRLTHQEFGGRAIQRDGAPTISNHATHVAGTLIGAGVRSDAIGMAPEAGLWAHDWNSDNAEMADAALNGLLVSNHSYGNIAGWANGDWSTPGTNEWHWWGDPNISPTEDFKFGFYDSKAAIWDEIAHTAPYYLIVKSAGNDRNNAGSLNHKVFLNGQWVSSSELRPRDGGDLGFDCLPTYSTSKNILTIGAVNDLPSGYNGPGSVSMSSFSGYGPTDDGRIKPDIVGNGVGLNSSTSTNDSSYGSLSGTSMSGPNVAGSLLLLQELYQRYHPNPMLSSTLKGLVIQTADEAGPHPGPDYQFGWGLLNSTKAAEVIRDNGIFKFIIENTLIQHDTFTTKIYANGLDEVKLTLCWTDPAGSPNSPALNNRTPKLINDLDLRLISDIDENEVYYPYTLNPESPASPPLLMDNYVDNVEQINAGLLPEGSYTVRITHKENLRGGSQLFSLISNTPKSPCQLGIAPDLRIQLPCNQSIIDEFRVPDVFEGVSFEYSMDNETFQTEPVFRNLEVGNYQIWIKDENGCVGIQRVQIEPEILLRFGLEDKTVFYATNSGQRQDLEFSSSRSSGWGADPFSVYISQQAVFATDGSANGNQGCGDLINAIDLAGKIAIFDRGGCEFGVKALKAQQAGALAAILINNADGSPILMAPGAVGNQVTIPVFMISQSSGQSLRTAIQNGEVDFTFGLIKALQPATCNQIENGAIRPGLLAGSLENSTIQWSNGANTLEIDQLAAGVYILTVTDESGCDTTFEFIVPTEPEPELRFETGDESCFELGDGSIQFLNQQQLNRFNIVINNQSINDLNLNQLTPGRYDIILTDTSNNCQYFYDFEINSGASYQLSDISGEEFVYEGIVYTFSVEEIVGATYLWQSSNGSIISGQGSRQIDVQFEANEDTAIIAVETQVENCIQSVEKEINIYTSSVISLDENVIINFHPNPFNEFIHVDLKLYNIQDIQIDIIDIYGQHVWRRILNTSTREQISTQHLIPGLYIMRIRSQGQQKSFKLIKN
jgi:hypothetical protein